MFCCFTWKSIGKVEEVIIEVYRLFKIVEHDPELWSIDFPRQSYLGLKQASEKKEVKRLRFKVQFSSCILFLKLLLPKMFNFWVTQLTSLSLSDVM